MPLFLLCLLTDFWFLQTIAWANLMENGESEGDICFIMSIFEGNIILLLKTHAI